MEPGLSTILICPGLRSLLGRRMFSIKTRKNLDKAEVGQPIYITQKGLANALYEEMNGKEE